MSLPICLAVSAYRNDGAVVALLEEHFDSWAGAVASIAVVDSGRQTSALETCLASRWPSVLYRHHRGNLGAAGNLKARFELAAEVGAEYLFAINHDGSCEGEAVGALYQAARSAEAEGQRVGAVYPLRLVQGGAYDLTGTSRFVRPLKRSRVKPSRGRLKVYWSSSNGALYSVPAFESGVVPDADLWHGFEDLDYGWRLHAAGYEQLLSTAVTLEDPYEYTKSLGVRVADKPAWMSYYTVRNLLLATRRTRQPLPVATSALARLALECGTTALLRKDKLKRFGYMAAGLVDAARNRGGRRWP